ncbi:MAG: response regulator [Spirochaetia bacterium]|nr:response regulator [Spirochaetia bacterium]
MIEKKYNILVVDDSIINQKLAKALLEKINQNVYIAEDGFKALEICKKENIDIIFMDIHMPNLDGIQASKKIREELKLNMPIIAMTGDEANEHLDEWQRSGINEFLEKPYNLDKISDIIKKFSN